MNRVPVDRIADAVLYEGYILYPYRPSIKNRQRWTFGGLYPEAYCRAQSGVEASGNQTECLVRGTPATSFDATVRFLHLTDRRVGEIAPPLEVWPDGDEPPCRPVEALRIGDATHYAWQEAEERAVGLGETTLGELSDRPRRRDFHFRGGRRTEPVRDEAGRIVGVLAREQQDLAGAVEASASEVAAGLFRVTLRVANRTSWEGGEAPGRDDALMRSLVSAHAVLGVRGGAFVSLLDPPEDCRGAAEACRNVGTWPVLVGKEGAADTMLASPIILYDYPQVAPESPGDFFDGTEIDEMLTLRILTLTDAEKGAMAAVDGRARALLARTESLGRGPRPGLHGTIRGLRAIPGEGADG